MNDYFVNEKLIKELKEMTLPNKKVPNHSSMQISNNATHKKELNEMDHKFKNLEKAYNKAMKRNSDTMEELKILKSTNDSLIKELSIIQISNEKILGEKINLENILEENKNYTRKLESRLVQGAKNQYLIEINNKLRKEVEDLKKTLDQKEKESEKFKNEIHTKNQELKIFNKALDIRTEEFKSQFKGDIKSTLLYDVGTVKQELDEYKEKYENILDIKEKFKFQLEDKNLKIQELNFAKAHLTELIIENENKLHNLEIERESYEKHCVELTDEKNLLREYLDKLSSDYENIKNKLTEDNKISLNKSKESENALTKKEEIIKKLSVEYESIKTQNSSNTEKIKNLENTLKIKINEFLDVELKNKDIIKSLSEASDFKYNLEKEILFLKDNISNLNKQIEILEKDNFEYMKKNKDLLISQESFQTDLVKQNQILQITETKLKEQITKNNNEIEKMKEERENFKKITNEAVMKCSSLIKENSELEKELNKKTLQIENLKNSNILLHKNFSSKICEEEKIIKIGESKLEENNMINLIRKEKEKNKEFLEEIKKLKNNY